jgi:tripartite-type tricarboxylate transporter receptor subunit TctC
MRRRAVLGGALGLLGLAVGAHGASAQPAAPRPFDERVVAEFYRGRTVRILVGFTAGGGFDVYSRVIARHLGKHIAGHPTVIVENMAGAASIVAANHVYNVGPRDGTVIGNISGPIILEQLFDKPGVQFDMARFRHLAVPVSETYLMVVSRRVGVTRIAEILGPGARQVVVGAIPGSTVEHAPLLLRDGLGANLKIVSGYKGTADVRMAIENGEVEAFFNTWTSAKVTALDKLKSGEWLILAQLTDTPLAGLPTPHVPAIPDLTQSAEQRQLLRFGTSVPNVFGKLYVMAPGVPPDRAAAVEAALRKTFTDPAFLAEAEKARLEIAPLYGEQIRKLVLEFLGMSPDVKARLQALMKPPRS